MNISELKPQISDIATSIPQHFAHMIQDDVIPDMEGETFPEELDEAYFNEDDKEGLDVLVYTKTKHA